MKKTLVLVHGHGVDARIWQRIVGHLPDYQVLTPDFSTATSYASIEEYADALYQLLREAHVEQCAVVGHSMGGYIALAFAEKYPQMLTGLGLFHSTAYADDEPKRDQRQKALAFMQAHGTDTFIAQTAPNMYAEKYAQRFPTVIKAHIETYKNLLSQAFIAGFKAIMHRPDRTHVLRQISVPVLFILGKEDKLIAFDKTMTLTSLPQKSQVVVFEKVGHTGMIEAADESIEALRQLMDSL
ncbi:MAG: alpha/beta fold hydrolase [Runella sp.]